MAAAREVRKDAEELLNAVQLACESDDLEPLKAALRSGIPIEASHRHVSYGHTCMHVACSYGNAKVVRYLLQNGAGKLLYSCGSSPYLNYPLMHPTTASVIFTLLEFHPELATPEYPYDGVPPPLYRAADAFAQGQGGWTLNNIKQLVEEHGCPVDVSDDLGLTALGICFISAVSWNARSLFWYLATERRAALSKGCHSHFRDLSRCWRELFSEEGRRLDDISAEAYDDLMRYLIVERGLDVDDIVDGTTPLWLAFSLRKVGPAALLIRWGASVWLALSGPSQLPTLSPEGAVTIKDAIRERAYTKRARLVAAYRYPRKHSNVRRWEREEEKEEENKERPKAMETGSESLDY
jgi:Ankyrin repeat